MSRLSVVIGLAFLLTGCGGGGNPASSSGGSGSSGSGGSASGHGTITAIIDGVAYTGTINAASNKNNVLTVTSNSADNTMSVNFAVAAAVGAQVLNSTSAMQLQVMQTNGATVTGNWIASQLGGSGTLTVNTLTASGATGTFNFVAPAAPGSTSPLASRTVVNGVFTATF